MGSQLYVSGNTSPRLLIYNDANTVSGSTSPNRVVSGGLTTLSGPRGIAVDMARDQIYVANFLNDSILVFHNARTVTGGAAPNRTITGAPLSRPSALFIEVVNDRLYVANTNGNSILIYDNASALNGGVAPSRTLAGMATTLNAPLGVYVDATRNLLYVANGNDQILVFSNAAAVSGNAAPTRIIAGLSSSTGIYIDVMADRLYVANTGVNSIAVFDDVSTANGSPAPDRTLSGGGTQLNQPRDVFVDSGTDRLYIANFGSNSILVFNDASTVNGNTVPDRSLSLTALTGPWGIYVDVTPIVIGSTASRDGYVLDDGSSVNTDPVGGGPKTGDVEDEFGAWRRVARQFYSFELAGIPSSTSVLSATLRLYQAKVENSPYGIGFLGSVIVDHVDYGTDLEAADYNAAALTPNIGILSTDASQAYKALNVTASVANDILASRLRSQYRLRFSSENSTNFDSDYVQLTDAEDSCCAANRPPHLVITIKP
jgi:DNA-binding beta-propeller fold protein YncE